MKKRTLRVRNKRHKVIPLHCRRRQQPSLFQIITVAAYQKRIKELRKNNKQLAVALQEERSNVSNQVGWLQDYARDTNQIIFAKVKLRDMAPTIQKLVTDLQDVLGYLDITGFQPNSMPIRDLRTTVKIPDQSTIMESASSSILEPATPSPNAPAINAAPAINVTIPVDRYDEKTEIYSILSLAGLGTKHTEDSSNLNKRVTMEIPTTPFDTPSPQISDPRTPHKTPPTPQFDLPRRAPKSRCPQIPESPLSLNMSPSPYTSYKKFHSAQSNASPYTLTLPKKSDSLTSKIPVRKEHLSSPIDRASPHSAKKKVAQLSSAERDVHILNNSLNDPAMNELRQSDDQRITFVTTAQQNAMNQNENFPINNEIPAQSEDLKGFFNRTLFLCEDMEFTEVIPSRTVFTHANEAVYMPGNMTFMGTKNMDGIPEMALAVITETSHLEGEHLSEKDKDKDELDSENLVSHTDHTKEAESAKNAKEIITENHQTANVSLSENATECSSHILKTELAPIEGQCSDDNGKKHPKSPSCRPSRKKVPIHYDNFYYDDDFVKTDKTKKPTSKRTVEGKNAVKSGSKELTLHSSEDGQAEDSEKHEMCLSSEITENVFEFSPSPSTTDECAKKKISRTNKTSQKPKAFSFSKGKTPDAQKATCSWKSQNSSKIAAGVSQQKGGKKFIFKSKNAEKHSESDTEISSEVPNNSSKLGGKKTHSADGKGHKSTTVQQKKSYALNPHKVSPEAIVNSDEILSLFPDTGWDMSHDKDMKSNKPTIEKEIMKAKSKGCQSEKNKEAVDQPENTDPARGSGSKSKSTFSGVSERSSRKRTTANNLDFFENIDEVIPFSSNSRNGTLSRKFVSRQTSSIVNVTAQSTASLKSSLENQISQFQKDTTVDSPPEPKKSKFKFHINGIHENEADSKQIDIVTFPILNDKRVLSEITSVATNSNALLQPFIKDDTKSSKKSGQEEDTKVKAKRGRKKKSAKQSVDMLLVEDEAFPTSDIELNSEDTGKFSISSAVSENLTNTGSRPKRSRPVKSFKEPRLNLKMRR